MTLYFAYGANTNVGSMAGRCPAAVPLATCVIPDHKLVFRGVADVVECDGAKVRGVMWRITRQCELALDRFEGYPTLYVKKYVGVEWKGKEHDLMLYVMRDRDTLAEPSGWYEACLREGYADFGVSAKQIDRAIREAQEWAARSKVPPKVRGGKQWRGPLAEQQDADDGFWQGGIAPWRRGIF